MIIYTALHIEKIEAEMMRDLATHGKQFAVVRRSPTSEKVWGFYNSMKLAEAACRRWRSRDVVTR